MYYGLFFLLLCAHLPFFNCHFFPWDNNFFHFPKFSMIAFLLSLEEIAFDDFIFSWNCSAQFNWAGNTYSRLLLVELFLTGHFCWLVELFILFHFIFLMSLLLFSVPSWNWISVCRICLFLSWYKINFNYTVITVTE